MLDKLRIAVYRGGRLVTVCRSALPQDNLGSDVQLHLITTHCQENPWLGTVAVGSNTMSISQRFKGTLEIHRYFNSCSWLVVCRTMRCSAWLKVKRESAPDGCPKYLKLEVISLLWRSMQPAYPRCCQETAYLREIFMAVFLTSINEHNLAAIALGVILTIRNIADQRCDVQHLSLFASCMEHFEVTTQELQYWAKSGDRFSSRLIQTQGDRIGILPYAFGGGLPLVASGSERNWCRASSHGPTSSKMNRARRQNIVK